MWISGAADNLIDAAQRPFDPALPVGVAVSGGGDSMALLHLLSRSNLHLHAVTVDHGLRDAARDEAAMVARFCAAHDIPHDTLHWQGRDASGNLMDQARRARYGLMSDWARELGIGQIALAHHGDDVAETFVMRLARRAGVDGLAAMTPDFVWGDVRFCRPLLGQSRADLHSYLHRQNLPYVDDPTNSDPAHERARVRGALANLADHGLSVDILRNAAQNLAEARTALRFSAHHFARGTVTQQDGDLLIDAVGFSALPREIRRRIATAAQCWLNGADYARRRAKQDTFLEAIRTGRQTTLAGCLMLARGETRRITREYAAVQHLKTATDALWDGRWVLRGPHAHDLHIAPLGPLGLPRCDTWRDRPLPRASLLASPAIWRGSALVAAPLAGFGDEWSACLAKPRDDFAGFLLSH
ncbi:tRNA lysidine(34) synthetase TilS [Oceaniglobus ichthyenteri]|uniref:tRNA lysidine(34) synthetase TilS n=1 Tax=Oceaniglobus ichthyenteri TaxID=2136177 RepID=UPI001F0CA458|nr:tRNA lysidine(34) synthetase TilS [Oceaniglobus ichthyenteri]